MTQPIPELRFSDLIGDWPREPRLSEWMLVPQDDINHFGRVTKDPDRFRAAAGLCQGDSARVPKPKHGHLH